MRGEGGHCCVTMSTSVWTSSDAGRRRGRSVAPVRRSINDAGAVVDVVPANLVPYLMSLKEADGGRG